MDLSLFAGCHVNVEIAHTVNIIDYMYKYIYKGCDASYIKLLDSTYAKINDDEILTYEYHRYISSCEAAWRLLSFEVNGKRYPSVDALCVHRHGHDNVTFNARLQDENVEDAEADEIDTNLAAAMADADHRTRKCTKLEQYLLRPAYVIVEEKRLDKSKVYIEENRLDMFTVSGTKKHKCEMKQYNGLTLFRIATCTMQYVEYHEMFSVSGTIAPHKKPWASTDHTHAKSYVYARQRIALYRMHVLYPRNGEDYYLRMMLGHCASPILSCDMQHMHVEQGARLRWVWDAYMTVDGTKMGTFQETAHAHRLADGVQEHIRCFNEICTYHPGNGRMLRQLFVALIMETDCPAMALWNLHGEVHATTAHAHVALAAAMNQSHTQSVKFSAELLQAAKEKSQQAAAIAAAAVYRVRECVAQAVAVSMNVVPVLQPPHEHAATVAATAAAAASCAVTRCEDHVRVAALNDELPEMLSTPHLWADIKDQRQRKNECYSDSTCRNEALLDLQERIESYGSKPYSEFGLPTPVNARTELQRERLNNDADANRQFLADHILLLSSENAAEQLKAYQAITHDHTPVDEHYVAMLRSSDPLEPFSAPVGLEFPPLYVDGMSGRGKTLLMLLVTAYYRMHDKIVLCAATTGIASLNHTINGHTYGFTSHSLFGIPVDEDMEIMRTDQMDSTLKAESDRAELLAHADLIIWDEIAMSNCLMLDCADALLRGTTSLDSTLPFGGKRFVGCGDFHQIPPVIPKANPEEVISKTILFSNVWQHFNFHTLCAPQRDRNARKHSMFVDSVGRGTCPVVPHTDHEHLIELENFQATCDVAQGLEHVFPMASPETLQDPKRAVLTTHNDSVESLNALMLERIAGKMHVLKSEDKLEEESTWDKHNFLHTDFLNSIRTNPASCPPHELHIKEGAMAMLMRNISKKDRLMNGTRVMIVHVHKFSIVVRTIDDQRLHAIPRILFKIRLPNAHVTIVRRQFPLRVAYAMTVHKCQGQTLNKVLLDVRKQPFSHGILYVACGRVKNEQSIMALVQDSTYMHNNHALASNLVWRELLPGNWTQQHTTEAPVLSEQPTQEEMNAIHMYESDDDDDVEQ
jgi:hypothetical protein